MNTRFNVRFQSTEEKIERALFELLRIRKYNDIYVKEICYEAGINRSSFYAHYYDINDLMLKTEQKLSRQMRKIFGKNKVFCHDDFVKMFEFLKERQTFYRAYLQTGHDSFLAQNDFLHYYEQNVVEGVNYNASERAYHMAFFSGGLLALSKWWLITGCKESPEQMAKIIYMEYHDKEEFLKNNNLNK